MFYGWVIVTLAFVAQFVVVGTFVQSFPVFLLPLAEEFGIGRAQASLPPVALMLCIALISPFIGRAVARFPIRNVMLAGALAMAAGFFALSQATAYWQLLILHGVVGSFSMGALGPIACNQLVVNWFDRRRAMALGIAMMGMSLSGAALIPASAWALSLWGWRAVYQGYALAALAMLPVIAWLAVTRPSDTGLRPDGEASGAAGASSPTAVGKPGAPAGTRELLGSASLWWIAAACGLVYFGVAGLMNHGIAFAIDRGIDPMRAAVLLSAISIGAASGKLVFGWLSDRIGERSAFVTAAACELIALVGFLFLSSYSTLVLCAGVFGLGIGGVAPIQAALLARSFGPVDFGPVMGLVGPLMMPFQIIAPPLSGYIFDTRGSYDAALWIFLVTGSAAILVMTLVRLPTQREYAPPQERNTPMEPLIRSESPR